MARRARRTLHPDQASHIKTVIESGSLLHQKQVLQYVCKLYRSGAVIRPEDRISLEIAILGVLSSARSDEKIRRWAIAALAYVGRKEVSQKTVLNAISQYHNEPQVVAAAIATLFKFEGSSAQRLISLQGLCTLETVTLSALQTVDPKELELGDLKINIETADAMPLKQALLLVGLDRAPPNIFDPKYSNTEIVRVLGQHHEPIVSQYSVWAAAESPNLGVKDIGIDVTKVDEQPPNVRSYVYRLFAEDVEASTLRHDIIAQGSEDIDSEARVGLAIGLRHSYYDGLEQVTNDWFYDEEDDDVRSHILDHITGQAEKHTVYKEIAKEQYDLVIIDKTKSERMEAAAAGTALWSEFKRMRIQSEMGFLDFQGGIVTNIQNFNGNFQGANSQTGQAHNSGSMQAVMNTGQIDKALDLLKDVAVEIDNLPLAAHIKGETHVAIAKAQKDPNRETFSGVLGVLQSAENAMQSVNGMAEHAIKLGGYATALAGLLL